MMERTSEYEENGNVIPVTLNANFFFERAVRSLDRFQYDKALKNFRKAVEYEPENPVNHCNVAGVLSEMGNYEASNDILTHVLENIDPGMTECYFYMANNFANMESYEEAERSLVTYLEEDVNGEFLAESEELMELLQYELDRPAPLIRIRSREGVIEHERARALLEEGKFTQAVTLLEEIVSNTPDFLAAHNNLALAYFYMGRFTKAKECIMRVLEQDSGNLHALCNLAIFLQYEGDRGQLAGLLRLLETTIPFHQEHLFKMATTMGILGRHRTAYGHFRRLLKDEEVGGDASLYHYCAAAASNSGLYAEAQRCWQKAAKLDPESAVPRFFLAQLQQAQGEGKALSPISYNYQLPFQEQLKLWKDNKGSFAEEVRNNPLLRSSFFWALRYGDANTKLQVTEALRWIEDEEMSEILQGLLKQQPLQEEKLQEAALLSLQRLIGSVPEENVLQEAKETSNARLKGLPEWREDWQKVIDQTVSMMDRRFDAVQKKDAELLWKQFVSSIYPDVPFIRQTEGWCAALEYLIAKMHNLPVTYREVAQRYDVSVSMVSRYARRIDDECSFQGSVSDSLPPFTENI
ncbi:tetratricopeptide repeat protein [Paenibacillus sp. FSL E2-8871]|uniref:DDE transposase family protein n=1 Tax=Paenibacillus odorifer TaxID=189426 RepID=A0A1R0Z911_9BACL|nr:MULTISPECIES: tetratricopeptide repeat protein [Paenibacillus]KAA1177111.1 tetratricopeptide repeat protein [Paenibacillus sp. B2(2019)]OMD49774.1 DDE transposase family protein [Paenibacillus odorifer]OME64636.1 DDE transposase family protein [Paenibacillus odorifer]